MVVPHWLLASLILLFFRFHWFFSNLQTITTYSLVSRKNIEGLIVRNQVINIDDDVTSEECHRIYGHLHGNILKSNRPRVVPFLMKGHGSRSLVCYTIRKNKRRKMNVAENKISNRELDDQTRSRHVVAGNFNAKNIQYGFFSWWGTTGTCVYETIKASVP